VDDDQPQSGVPPTVIKPKKAPSNYTSSSRFVAGVFLASVLGTTGLYYSVRANQSASTPAVTPSPIPSQPPPPPVPDPSPSLSPTPAPRASVSVSTMVRVFTPPPMAPQVPRTPPTLSPDAQYEQEEVVRTLASRRSASVVKFSSQDDQARADLAAAGAPQTAGALQGPAPVSSSTPASAMFASDGASAAEKFLGEHKSDVGYIPLVSDDQVDAGTPIQCSLSWNIDSKLPEGTVRAMVTSTVFSSRNGHEVSVIPQGTTLLTTYNSREGAGNARLQAVGTRLVFEDGREFSLGGSSQAAGLQGEAGFPARVNTGAGKQFSNALLTAVIQAGIGLASKPSANINVGNVQPPQAQAPQATFYVRAGTPFTFVVADDLPLKEYRTK
jgi:type IV secretory pathway VirB10-like protein